MKTQDPSGSDPRAGTDRMIQPAARKRRRWLLAAGFLTITTVALAATLVISGDFTSTKIVSGYDVYDATDATAYVQQGINNTGFRVTSSPNNADWIGGTVIGEGHNKTLSWRDLYDKGNGAGFLIQGSNNFTTDGLYIEWSWDGIRPAAGCGGVVLIKRCWLNDWRDDGVEADVGMFDFDKLRIENNLFENGHSFLSTRPGGGAEPPPYRVEMVNNVMSLGLHLEDREKREFSWSGPVPGTQSGQLHKTWSNGSKMTLLYKNNIVKLVEAPGVNKSVLNLLPENATIDSNSGGNTLVWLGGSPDGLTMETIDGVLVPVDFDIDPAIWDVTSNATTWNNARSNWINNVWNGGGTDTQAPTVDVTAPTNGATVSGTITVTASASDNVGVAGVQFKVDGVNLGSEDTAAPYSRNWDTTAASNGSHTITAVARDAANNTTTSSGVAVTVDNSGGGTGTTIEFNPTEDTHIREGQPDATWGSYPYMRVRHNTSGVMCFGVLKFNVTDVSGTVTGVKLRMRTEDVGMNDTTAYQVTGSWSEGTLTWNNSSLNWGSSLGSVTNISPNAWYEINLGTSYITGNGTYSIGIKTTSTANNQDWSSSESGNPPVLIVEVDSGTGGSAPGQASSPSPSNSASGVDVNANLSWTAGSGAASHDVYFGTDSTPDSGEFKGNQTGTTYDPGALANNTTYYWRIDEKNANGTTTGTVWSFTTAVSLPGQATSPSPSNGATGVVVPVDLKWTAGSGATSHDLYFGTDSTPDAGEFRGNQTATAFDPGMLSANTTYYWRIDEVNSAGTTTGTVWNFTTAAGTGDIGFVAASSASTGGSSATNLAVNKPTGVSEGMFMLAGISVSNADATITAPSGWTLVRSITDINRLSIYSKVAGASEPSSYTWQSSISRKLAGGILAFSGVDMASPIQTENGVGEASSGTSHSTPSITTSGSDTWLVSLFADRHDSASSWSPPTGATERVDVRTSTGNNDASLEINTEGPISAGGHSHTATASSSSNIACMGIVALNALPGGTSGPLIDNLTVNDSTNAADWSTQTNLQSGDAQYGDRTYTWSTVPGTVAGCEWIRTANDSKQYTGATLATFTVGTTTDVYVAHNDDITSKPSWLSSWTDTGMNMTNSNGSVRSLYVKSFMSGDTVTLGPNGDTVKSMYSVIVCPDGYE